MVQKNNLHDRSVIIFDFDGTLADTEGYIVAAATQALSEAGFTPEQMGDVSRVVGPPYPGAFATIYGVSEEEDLAITNRYFELYDWKSPASHELYPGMRALLEDLTKHGKKLAIASSKTRMRLGFCVEDLGLDSLFSCVFAKEDVDGGGKAELIRMVMEKLGASADQCVMIGDRFYDIQGARAAGTASIGVTFGTHKRAELEEAGADAVVDSIDELHGVLLA